MSEGNVEQANKWAVQANEQKRVTQYLRLNFWFFWTSVHGKYNEKKKHMLRKNAIYPQFDDVEKQIRGLLVGLTWEKQKKK